MVQVRQQGPIRVAPLAQFHNTRSEMPAISSGPAGGRIGSTQIVAQVAFGLLVLLLVAVVASAF
jgi:hypothetical protein